MGVGFKTFKLLFIDRNGVFVILPDFFSNCCIGAHHPFQADIDPIFGAGENLKVGGVITK